MSNNIANPQSAVAAVRTALFPFAVFLLLALCLTAVPARAGITFTVTPNVVSNTYNGLITLQINGLTNTSVVIQKFLDVNSNNVIDSGDLLVQQFRLAVGQSNVFMNAASGMPVTVTNFMPADTSSTTNEIITPLNFQNGDFAQTLAGQYLYKVSTPSGQAAVTNLIVTNAFFSTYVTGTVTYAESSGPGETTNIPVPDTIVLLWTNQEGAPIVQAGTVANSNGDFALRAPPGTYYYAAAKSNFVDGVAEAPAISAKSTNYFAISLTPATTNITGRVINAANTNGLGGISGMAFSTNGYISFYFTDTNGYFYAPFYSPVTNSWTAPVDSFAAAFQGCLTWQTNQALSVSNKVVNITNALPPVRAIFYGVVSNSTAAPMPGVYLYATDNAGHQSIGMTDSQGKYVVGVSAGTNQWTLYIPPVDNPGLTNPYVISPLYLQTQDLQTNQAVQQNFGLEQARYTISGTVSNYDGQPIPGAVVFAEMTNDQFQAFSAVTDTNGLYSLDVSSGTWTVGVTPESLESLGYNNVADFPTNEMVTISDSSGSADGVNFTMLVCGEIEISVTNVPDGIEGQYYETNLGGDAKSCQPITSWSTAYGLTLTSIYDHTNVLYPPGTPIYSQTNLIGYLESSFSFGYNTGNPDYAFFINCTGTATAYTGGGAREDFSDLSATVNLTGPINSPTNITVYFLGNSQPWKASPTIQNGSNYTTTLTLAEYGDNPMNAGNSYSLSPGFAVTSSPGLSASNTVASVLGGFYSVTAAGNSIIIGSSTPYTNQNNSEVFIRKGTNVGQYYVSADGPQTNNLDGLSLSPDGTLSGIPITNGMFNFSVMAEDTNSDVSVQPLSLYVFPPISTSISGPTSAQAGWVQSSNIFQMQLSGLSSNLNYTVLMTTNLASPNWVPIYTTNNPTTNALSVPDTAATNATRFYRVQVSQ